MNINFFLLIVVLIVNTLFAILAKESKEQLPLVAKIVLLIPPVAILYLTLLNLYDAMTYVIKRLPGYFK